MTTLNHLRGCLGLLLLGGLLLMTEPVAVGQESQTQPPVFRQVRVSVQLVQRDDLVGGGVKLGMGGVQVGGEWQIRRSQATVWLLIVDGGEGYITVGESVPNRQWFYRYSLEQGYLTPVTVPHTVSTGFRIRPTILPGERVRLQLIPQIRYLTDREPGEIAFVEASLDVIVLNGQSAIVAGDRRETNSVLFQILGYRERRGSTDLVLVVTPWIQ